MNGWRLYTIIGKNYDRPNVRIEHTVTARSATEAIRQVCEYRKANGLIVCHKMTTTPGF